jgi:hypothetical protein
MSSAAAIVAVALAACTGAGNAALPVSNHAQVYHDGARWSITIPPGWRATPFSVSKGGFTSTGVQVSNVRLPLPSLLPGFPIQVNSQVLPAGGIGLIVATDADPRLSRGRIWKPPLPMPGGGDWETGSSLAGTPYLTLLWFRVRAVTYVASAKIGARVTGRQMRILGAIVRSLR